MRKVHVGRLLSSKSGVMLCKSKRNLQKPRTGSHSSSSKTSRLTGTTSTSFFFTVNELQINDDTQLGGVVPQALYDHWTPPLYSAGFTRTFRERVYQWTDGVINNAGVNYETVSGTYTRYTTASVFYSDQMLQFRATVSDPTLHNIAEAEPPYHRWYRLSFHNEPGVSRVDIAGRDNFIHGTGATWVAPLGLENYCYPNTSTSANHGLAGNLGILIALIAFSCSPESLDNVLMYHRAWDSYMWRGHPYPSGSTRAIGSKSYEY